MAEETPRSPHAAMPKEGGRGMARLFRRELGARVRLDPLSKGLLLRNRSVALRQIVFSAKTLLTRKAKAREEHGRLPLIV
jgi:hypothetical protein